MAEVTTISTDQIKPRERLDFWSAVVANTFAPFEISARPAAEFHGSFTATQVSDMLLAQTRFAPSAASRRKHMIRSAHFDGFMFVIPIMGRISYADDAVSSVANVGDIAFYDYSRPFSFSMDCEGERAPDPAAPTCINSINVTIPRSALTRAMGQVTSGAGLIIGADQPSNPIIRQFFSSLMAHGQLLDPVIAARMSAIGLDLLVTGLAERLSRESSQGTNVASLVYRAKTFIEGHLWNADLNVVVTAAALSVSVRRLQMAFAEQQLTVEEFIWERRLQRAYRQLCDEVCDSMSVGAISYGAGFTNQSHFTRRFTQRFGQTPTHCRRLARLARFAHPDKRDLSRGNAGVRLHGSEL